jgi:hypothetical protein
MTLCDTITRVISLRSILRVTALMPTTSVSVRDDDDDEEEADDDEAVADRDLRPCVLYQSLIRPITIESSFLSSKGL